MKTDPHNPLITIADFRTTDLGEDYRTSHHGNRLRNNPLYRAVDQQLIKLDIILMLADCYEVFYWRDEILKITDLPSVFLKELYPGSETTDGI